MLPRGASSIRGVFLVLARHERRSRCCGVDRLSSAWASCLLHPPARRVRKILWGARASTRRCAVERKDVPGVVALVTDRRRVLYQGVSLSAT
jgi:hypothetical protein